VSQNSIKTFVSRAWHGKPRSFVAVAFKPVALASRLAEHFRGLRNSLIEAGDCDLGHDLHSPLSPYLDLSIFVLASFSLSVSLTCEPVRVSARALYGRVALNERHS